MRRYEVVRAAARGLADAGFGTFTLSQLVIGCWELDPPAFGLEGFEGLHPDVNKVKAVVYHANTRDRCGVTPAGVNRFRYKGD